MSSKTKLNNSKPRYEEQKEYFCIKCEEYIDLFDGGATYYETDDEYMCDDCVIELLTQEDEEDQNKTETDAEETDAEAEEE